MIGGMDADTFMVRLMFGVIGSAIAVFICTTCYNVCRIDRRMQAYARSREEHNAPINRSFVCGSSQTTAAQWLEHGDRNAQPRRQSDAQLQQYRQQVEPPADAQQVPQQSAACIPSETALDGACSRSVPISSGGKSWFQQRFVLRSFVDSTGTSTQHAGATALPLFGWNRMALSGPPSLSSVAAEAPTDDGTTEHQRTQVDANRFASPPLVVLATGDARVAFIKSLRQCFMLHSVMHAASAEMLKNVLLEAAELRKLDPHPSLLPLCAVVTDQPYGEVGLLSELTTGSLASLLDTSPVQLTWANGLLALATDVAAGLAHLHGLGLLCATTLPLKPIIWLHLPNPSPRLNRAAHRASMLSACNPHHSHGRLFLFNVMVTSSWRAKLSEYALDPYLKLTRGGLGSTGGYDLLPSENHPANSVLFLSPEKCSGRMAPVVRPRRVPTTAEPKTACKCGWVSNRWRLARTQRSLFAPIAPSDARPAELKTTSTADTHGLLAVGNEAMTPGARSGSPASLAGCSSAVLEAQTQEMILMDEQRADAWAFGSLLASLALHERRAKEHSKAGLHASQRRGQHAKSAASGCCKRRDDQLADDMYGWEDGASVSKDKPGRCMSISKQLVAVTSVPEHAATSAAEGRPLSRRDPRVERKFKALGELSRHLKHSRVCSSRGSSSDHSEFNDTNAPPPSVAPPSAPPSPPETSPADAYDDAPALARVVAHHQTSAENWSLERPRREIKEAARIQLKAAVELRRQQGRVRLAPALQRTTTSEPQGPQGAAESNLPPDMTLSRSVSALQLGGATADRRVRLSRMLKPGTQPANGKEAANAPLVKPTRYVLMLRLCQGKVSPLDGVTLSCCPRPLLQLATQCCTHNPEERPGLAAVLEQLQEKVLLSVDSAAHGVGAQRPLPALEGWRDAAERTLLGEEPANDDGGGVLGPAGAHAAGSDHNCSA